MLEFREVLNAPCLQGLNGRAWAVNHAAQGVTLLSLCIKIFKLTGQDMFIGKPGNGIFFLGRLPRNGKYFPISAHDQNAASCKHR